LKDFYNISKLKLGGYYFKKKIILVYPSGKKYEEYISNDKVYIRGIPVVFYVVCGGVI